LRDNGKLKQKVAEKFCIENTLREKPILRDI
jgi:hypothetical protein